MRASLESGQISSPASCSFTNRSYGLSVVERADHVVAIAPGIRAIAIVLESARVGDTAPYRASGGPIVRRNAGKPATPRPLWRRHSGGIVHKRVHLRGRWRQTGQIKIGAPNQSSAIGGRRDLQASACERIAKKASTGLRAPLPGRAARTGAAKCPIVALLCR